VLRCSGPVVGPVAVCTERDTESLTRHLSPCGFFLIKNQVNLRHVVFLYQGYLIRCNTSYGSMGAVSVGGQNTKSKVTFFTWELISSVRDGFFYREKCDQTNLTDLSFAVRKTLSCSQIVLDQIRIMILLPLV
jgi:hypothetical protein